MTIDSSWLRAFKEEAGEAFTKTAPFRANAVFTDGQIRLMQGGLGGGVRVLEVEEQKDGNGQAVDEGEKVLEVEEQKDGNGQAVDEGEKDQKLEKPRDEHFDSRWIWRARQTWDDYVRRQFLKPLAKYLETCDTVVLAFDCYAYVPAAKAMTQTKRRKHVPPMEFGERSPLPTMVPMGEAWNVAISNRTFKAKIIELVLLLLPNELLRGKAGKQLIVDYQDPLVYKWNPETNRAECQLLDGLAPMGEADVKFTRYADLFERLMVDSIDGDSIPIALVHHERCLQNGGCPPRVSVYRMEIREPSTDKPDKTDKKRKRETPKRTYEYVDILALYQALRTVVLQSIGRTHLPLHAGHEIRMLTALICLTSTDFSRNLPQLSGKTVYDLLPRIWMTLVMVYDPDLDQLRVGAGEAGDRLVAMIYSEKFPRHVTIRRGIAGVLGELRGSGLSQRVKDTLPTPERIESTVRNVNWVLQYWRCEPRCPDPVSDEFGYRRDARGITHYADLLAL